MRRLALAALCGTLVLAACSDQSPSPTEPAVPEPEQTFGSTCDHGRYPLRDVALLIPSAFPTRALRAEALVRVGAIALLWDFCKDRLARQAALKTIAWIDSKVTSPQADALKAAILNGFGGASTADGDYIAGVYVPGTIMVFTTPSGRATLELRPGAFTLPTLITIRRLSDDFRLSGFPAEQQDPPFWDYDATNSSTDNTVQTHTLATPGTATMAFCFRSDGEGGQVSYDPPGAKIGHNPVGGGFEFVEEITPVPHDLLLELHACASSDVGLTGGLPGFARYLGSMARNLLLPEPLQAAMVGPRGPIAGSPISLSPFGIVVPSNELSFSDGGDPSERTMYDGYVRWGCGIENTCYPAVRLTDGESGVSGATINVELIPVTGTGAFTEADYETEDPGSVTSVATDEYGEAVFDQLKITGPYPGDYKLKFSGGGGSVTSGTFSMNATQID